MLGPPNGPFRSPNPLKIQTQRSNATGLRLRSLRLRPRSGGSNMPTSIGQIGSLDMGKAAGPLCLFAVWQNIMRIGLQCKVSLFVHACVYVYMYI